MQLLSPSIVLVSAAVRPDHQEQSRIKSANAADTALQELPTTSTSLPQSLRPLPFFSSQPTAPTPLQPQPPAPPSFAPSADAFGSGLQASPPALLPILFSTSGATQPPAPLTPSPVACSPNSLRRCSPDLHLRAPALLPRSPPPGSSAAPPPLLHLRHCGGQRGLRRAAATAPPGVWHCDGRWVQECATAAATSMAGDGGGQ
ncbi:proline-rich receptor-like protein kinase PERK2 [Panicum virgatum]|uniref:proline-rich receptor-like protein kinase PERK2 n=1 Tax=Panicum virgatum TaxID=38727 RepID=UPI0019D54129|nr:proline-rich receptor-like protein kinase PERK2 [Panicum virgatum]